ncbi:hypothetical protein SAY86_000984 [Trapa natans]|uniref:Uncharacterized protein n=1 Tax=Trapa natans TaxID=22666 RepID=A0AAN7MFW0_TRANT|nr:hypothetical protein SAY86_000984 [Trapa natans]
MLDRRACRYSVCAITTCGCDTAMQEGILHIVMALSVMAPVSSIHAEKNREQVDVRLISQGNEAGHGLLHGSGGDGWLHNQSHTVMGPGSAATGLPNLIRLR